MKKGLLTSFKQLLIFIGSRLPDAVLNKLQTVVYYMRLGRWMSKHHFHFNMRVSNRQAVFDVVANKVRDSRS